MSTEAASTVNVTVLRLPRERQQSCAGLFCLSMNPNSLTKQNVTVNWVDGFQRMGRRSECIPGFAEVS